MTSTSEIKKFEEGKIYAPRYMFASKYIHHDMTFTVVKRTAKTIQIRQHGYRFPPRPLPIKCRVTINDGVEYVRVNDYETRTGYFKVRVSAEDEHQA